MVKPMFQNPDAKAGGEGNALYEIILQSRQMPVYGTILCVFLQHN